MPRNNCDLALTPVDGALEDYNCPKCGAEMDPIESGGVGLPVQRLELCPSCYLVVWTDQDGFHTRQGVPMKKGDHPSSGSEPRSEPPWLVGEPEEC